MSDDAAIVTAPDGNEFVVELWKPSWRDGLDSGTPWFSRSGRSSRPGGGSTSSGFRSAGAKPSTANVPAPRRRHSDGPRPSRRSSVVPAPLPVRRRARDGCRSCPDRGAPLRRQRGNATFSALSQLSGRRTGVTAGDLEAMSVLPKGRRMSGVCAPALLLRATDQPASAAGRQYRFSGSCEAPSLRPPPARQALASAASANFRPLSRSRAGGREFLE